MGNGIGRADSWGERVRKARALAILFAAGAGLVLVTLLLPNDAAGAASPVLRLVFLAAALAAVLFLGAGWLPAWSFHMFLAAGTVLISTVVYFGSAGGNQVTYPILYSWVALYAFYFFSVGAAVAHLAGAGALYAAIVQLSGGHSWVSSLVMTFGVVSVTGAMIGWLVHQIRRLAQTDALTGLANRRTWDDTFLQETLRAGRQRVPLSLVVLDLDGFKQINDLQGHLAGDLLLKEVAAAWHSCLRTTDLLARLGGDEFAVLLPDCRLEAARIVVNRLRRATGTTDAYSVGVTEWDGRESPDGVMARADQALYEAKSRGGGCSIFVSEAGVPLSDSHGDEEAAIRP